MINLIHIINLLSGAFIVGIGVYILTSHRVVNKFKKILGILFTSFGILFILFTTALTIW